MENKSQLIDDYIDIIGKKQEEFSKEFKKITDTFKALSLVLTGIGGAILYLIFARISTMGFTKISMVAIWVLFTLIMIFMALESSIRAMRKSKDFVDNIAKSYQEISSQGNNKIQQPTLPEIQTED